MYESRESDVIHYFEVYKKVKYPFSFLNLKLSQLLSYLDLKTMKKLRWKDSHTHSLNFSMYVDMSIST